MKKALLICSLVIGLNASSMAIDQVVHPTGVTGHDGGNWPATLGHLTDMLNATKIGFLTADHAPNVDTSADTSQGTNNPAVWKQNGNYQNNWSANSKLDTNTTANAKCGWAVIDLGQIINRLSNVFIWGAPGANDGEEAKEINMYYSSGVGIDTLPAMPNSKSTTGDYDFSVGDWVKVNSGYINLPYKPTTGLTPQATQNMGLVSARYIGVEIITMWDSAKTRPAIGQIEITMTPPPAGTVIYFQ